MLKLGDLKQGDIVLLNDEGVQREGTVVKISHEEHQALINNGVQEFWFKPEELSPLPLDEDQLMKLNFQREELEDGSVKYKKGAFRILIPAKNDFSHFEIWYREEKRQIMQPIFVHQLQNHYLEMTKVHLTDEVM